MPDLETKTMSLTEFVKEVVPYTGFSKLSVERQARDQLREGKDFIFIYETQVITIPVGSIQRYFGTEVEVKVEEFDEIEPVEEATEFETAAEFKEDEQKRKPGRPRAKA